MPAGQAGVDDIAFDPVAVRHHALKAGRALSRSRDQEERSST
ncbi:hypothetical protein FM106_07140 [Brachybacterium faecium]|nr:hypothetical protein FM106_07140 [Brachybacterium faecium]